MRVEDRSEQSPHAEPPIAENWETSFAIALRNAIDDLSTCQAIAEKLRDTQGNMQVESFIRHWKQALVQHLEETAEVAINNLLVDLDRIQVEVTSNIAETEPTFSPGTPSQIEDQQRAEIKKLHQPFLIASVCRADLQEILTDEEIARLDDTDMERIADKTGDAYRDSGSYWESLEIIAKAVMKNKEAMETEASSEADINR